VNRDQTPKGVDRLFELFDRALEQPPEARVAWLQDQASVAPELIAEVLELVRAHAAEGVLERTLPTPVDLSEESDPHTRLKEALSDRYHGLRRLGEGGMAFIYEARERKHDRTVVIKVLRPEIAQHYGEERFLQEVRIASTLAHPHILPLIDSGRADERLYFVMPSVEGETLLARLRRVGPLSPGEAGALLGDVADALAYAHERGLIHRDLKPANVLIADTHAYLMDFGVAKPLNDEAAAGLTQPGYAPGTPRYMAPEQFDGQHPVGPPSDVFSWGQLAHETLTGTVVGPTAHASASVATRLMAQQPELPSDWAGLIGRALSDNPRERPTASEIRTALTSTPSGPNPKQERTGSAWIRRLVAVFAAGVISTGLWWIGVRRAAPPLESAALAMPIAVAELRNETGDPSLDVLGRLASDWITQGLRDLGQTVVPWAVSRDLVARAESDSAVDPVPLLHAGARAGTVVTGRIYRVDDNLEFRADITDAAEGRLLVATQPVSVPQDQAKRGIEELRDRLMGSIGGLTGERTAGLAALRNRTPTFDAYRAFDRGLEHYLAQEYGLATPAFLQAFERDTTFLTTLLYAASTASNQGDQATTDSLIAFLQPRRDRLSRYDDARWQFHEALSRGASEPALRALHEAVKVAPGSRAAYNLALIANGLNRPDEALEALLTLDPEGGEIRGWAQYWTQKAHALHLLGRFEEEAEAASEMERRYPERDVATVLRARALAAQGRMEELEAHLAASALRPSQTYWSHGAALTVVGEALLAHGTSGAAEPFLARGEAWLSARIEDEPDHLAHLYWLASVYYDQRRWQDAAAAAEGLVRRRPENRTYRGMAAVAAARIGAPERAATHLDAPAWGGRSGNRSLYAARTHVVLQDPERALTELAAALDLGIGGWAWAHASGHHDFELFRQSAGMARLLEPRVP